MADDNTTIDISSSGSRKVSETEELRREAAKAISPLDYWTSYVLYRTEYKDTPAKWTRREFLMHLQEHYKLDLPPSGSAISGKHNYCTDTLIPKLGEDRDSPWYGLTKADLEKAKLPPTARDTREVWAKNEELANATKALFED